MRLRINAVLTLALLVGLAACGSRESEGQRHHDANTVAGKIGQVAHRAAVEADKAGRVIGRQMDKAAHDAREGWKEDAHRDRNRQ
jgi:hypothetical protein